MWHDKLMTTFIQLTTTPKNFLRCRLLVLGLNKSLVECAIVCIKSEVVLTLAMSKKSRKMILEAFDALIIIPMFCFISSYMQ